jgi:hypothetical protein
MAPEVELRYDAPGYRPNADHQDRRRLLMIRALVSAAPAARRGGRRAARSVVLGLAMALGLATARAQDQQDPYSATVKVDATADSAAAARTLARTDGQRRALAEVVQRLSGASEPPPLPKLDDQAITDMVDSFEVANEKMSKVRYLADYTFHFRSARIQKLMRSINVAIAAQNPGSDNPANDRPAPEQSAAKPVVVLAVFQDGDEAVLWNDPNPWREAWGQIPLATAPVRLSLPLGGAGDLSVIDADQALAGDADALTGIAQKNGGDEVIVALATERRDGDRATGLDVAIKRYRQGRLTDSRGETIDAQPGESEADLFKRAAGLVMADIEHGAPATSDKEASLAATVPIASLNDWVVLQRRLAAVPGIRRIDLLSLSRRQAKVEIRYVGNPDQLKSSLAQADLSLNGGDPDWRLAPAGTPAPN